LRPDEAIGIQAFFSLERSHDSLGLGPECRVDSYDPAALGKAALSSPHIVPVDPLAQ